MIQRRVKQEREERGKGHGRVRRRMKENELNEEEGKEELMIENARRKGGAWLTIGSERREKGRGRQKKGKKMMTQEGGNG